MRLHARVRKWYCRPRSSAVDTRERCQLNTSRKSLLKALNREILPTPPVWMMRQAGRYLPEYKKTRARAGSFLNLCYTPELAAEVTLQPIRRFGFDAAILFADILLLPHALGCELHFPEGRGPQLSVIRNSEDLGRLASAGDIHRKLEPVYGTVRILRDAVPGDVALIGFAGAPWTVATYMIAGRGTPGQEPAHAMLRENRPLFDQLMELLTDATIRYLEEQARAGAEVLKIFDSWSGSLTRGEGLFDRYCTQIHERIVKALNLSCPDVPVIGFPRGAGRHYRDYATRTGVSGLALDTDVDVDWAAKHLQPATCVQGNLDPRLMVTGGRKLVSETRRIVGAFANGPHIFNLGHGITPDGDPDNVLRMLDAVRENPLLR